MTKMMMMMIFKEGSGNSGTDKLTMVMMVVQWCWVMTKMMMMMTIIKEGIR